MKRSSNRLVLLVGIFLAVVAFVLIAILLGNGGASPGTSGASAAPTTANVVVAAKDLTLGSKITADEVSTKAVPLPAPPDSYADPSEVIGQTVREDVTNGQLITSEIINGPSNGINNITVPPGFVGISVQVDQTTGVGTLIKAGDYVDVVTGFSAFPEVTYKVLATPAPKPTPTPKGTPAPSGTPAPVTVNVTNVDVQYDQNSVKTVVEGLQVLGTLLPPTAAPTDQTASAAPGTTLNGQQEIVILAATPQQAEALRFAQISGTIALVLRSSKDCQTADGQSSQCPIVPTTGITLRQMVDQFGVLPPQVIQVVEPGPYPSPMPSLLFPSPSPSPSESPSASTAP